MEKRRPLLAYVSAVLSPLSKTRPAAHLLSGRLSSKPGKNDTLSTIPGYPVTKGTGIQRRAWLPRSHRPPSLRGGGND
jgi:hypothetical protein